MDEMDAGKDDDVAEAEGVSESEEDGESSEGEGSEDNERCLRCDFARSDSSRRDFKLASMRYYP